VYGQERSRIAWLSIDRVRLALADLGLDATIREFDASTATALDAAAAIGTDVERIVKTLVFMAGDQPILVLVSGPNRVDTSKIGARVGARVVRANADQVRAATGFAIGGVAPLGLAAPMTTCIDRDLLQYPEVWAAAGTPNAVFSIAPARLVEITGGEVADIAVRPG
jgi:prolyl-tRNA editing enzyme YbaK/EbsC (Cys-tRNA(Pro) deacylase)